MFKSRLNSNRLTTKILFVFIGIISTVWFLIRVIPKPSRAAYPCMRATAPIMASFVIYISTLAGSVIGLKKARQKLLQSKYFVAFGFLLLAFASLLVFNLKNSETIFANTHQIFDIQSEPANSPIGVPKGYFPGRVVWVMDKNATNENCTNTAGDYWFEDKNTNQDVVNTMLANGIKKYADTSTVAIAWDCLFKYFNKYHDKGMVGYSQGEKIVIKVNMTNMGNGGRHLGELMDATPQLMLALLEQLVDSVGVAQSDITIGDPYRGFSDEYWDKCHSKYPDIHYIEGLGTDGREQTQLTANDVFFNSDDAFSSRLPQAYYDAAYMINMPCLKSHGSAGITLAAKNHQGSVIGPDQDPTNQNMGAYLHYDYPDADANRRMGMYRHLVDYMAHSKLGGNTLLYIVDAIWSGRDWQGFVDKWGIEPFSGDYTSSIFLSQDAVATESVGYDFLYNEYKEYSSTYHENNESPLWTGVQDYILQAADPANWASGILYDPDHADHSQPVSSLGVHEHWNNFTDKQYSVNLTGQKGGIELVSIPSDLVNSVPLQYTHETINEASAVKNISHVQKMKIYPNPVKDYVNISFDLSKAAKVKVDLFTISGKKIMNLLNTVDNAGSISHRLRVNNEILPQGIYLCQITTISNGNVATSSAKIQIIH